MISFGAVRPPQIGARACAQMFAASRPVGQASFCVPEYGILKKYMSKA